MAIINGGIFGWGSFGFGPFFGPAGDNLVVAAVHVEATAKMRITKTTNDRRITFPPWRKDY